MEEKGNLDLEAVERAGLNSGAMPTSRLQGAVLLLNVPGMESDYGPPAPACLIVTIRVFFVAAGQRRSA